MKLHHLCCGMLVVCYVFASVTFAQKANPVTKVRIGEDGSVRIMERYTRTGPVQENVHGEKITLGVNEANNHCDERPTTHAELPDLVVTNVTLVDDEGPTISYLFTISNTGSAASSSCTAGIKLNDFTDSYEIDQRGIPGINPNMAYSLMSPMTTTVGGVPEGNYWLYVYADYTGVVSELHEWNNFEMAQGLVLIPPESPVFEDAYEPMDFTLYPNYPNPFNPSTTIRFNLKKQDLVVLTIVDITGRMVETLVDDYLEAGEYEVVWDAGDMPSGVYLCVLKAGSELKLQKLILEK